MLGTIPHSCCLLPQSLKHRLAQRCALVCQQVGLVWVDVYREMDKQDSK